MLGRHGEAGPGARSRSRRSYDNASARRVVHRDRHPPPQQRRGARPRHGRRRPSPTSGLPADLDRGVGRRVARRRRWRRATTRAWTPWATTSARRPSTSTARPSSARCSSKIPRGEEAGELWDGAVAAREVPLLLRAQALAARATSTSADPRGAAARPPGPPAPCRRRRRDRRTAARPCQLLRPPRRNRVTTVTDPPKALSRSSVESCGVAAVEGHRQHDEPDGALVGDPLPEERVGGVPLDDRGSPPTRGRRRGRHRCRPRRPRRSVAVGQPCGRPPARAVPSPRTRASAWRRSIGSSSSCRRARVRRDARGGGGEPLDRPPPRTRRATKLRATAVDSTTRQLGCQHVRPTRLPRRR